MSNKVVKLEYVSDGLSNFSISATRAMFESARPAPAAPQQRPTSQSSTSASNYLFDLMASNPNATRNVAAFGVKQAQKHPDVAKKVATTAFEQAQARPEVTRQVAAKAWDTTQLTPTPTYNQPSVRSLTSELETKLMIGHPPPSRAPRPMSYEPPPPSLSVQNTTSFDPFEIGANHDRSWDLSASVPRSQSSQSFASGKVAPKRPPPPKFGAMRKSPTMPATFDQPVSSLPPTPFLNAFALCAYFAGQRAACYRQVQVRSRSL